MSEIAKMRTAAQACLDWQPSEEQEQITVFEWAMLMEKQFPELALLFHIGNGGVRSKSEAVRFKKAGVKAGVPDLFLPVPRGGFHGLWIEMKRRKGGRVSEEQSWWMHELEKQMYRTVVCHGSDEACDVLYNYLTQVEQ